MHFLRGKSYTPCRFNHCSDGETDDVKSYPLQRAEAAETRGVAMVRESLLRHTCNTATFTPCLDIRIGDRRRVHIRNLNLCIKRSVGPPQMNLPGNLIWKNSSVNFCVREPQDDCLVII